jgi:hypothetical protein
MVSIPHISSGSQSGCSHLSQLPITEHLPLSRYAFQRHIRRSTLAHTTLHGVRVYRLPCHCFVWVYPSGERELAPLPF